MSPHQTPSEPIRFYLDFVSTYSYFAALRVDSLAATYDRVVDWRVVSLPHVFKAVGTLSPLAQPLKLAHNHQDVLRVAAMMDLPFKRPEGQPDVQWARLLFHRLRERDPALAGRFARACMALRFGQGRELNTAAALTKAAAGEGIAVADIERALDDSNAKASLIAMSEVALADGMFGAPFACDGVEKFWGHDRVLQQLPWWLARQMQGSAEPSANASKHVSPLSTPSIKH